MREDEGEELGGERGEAVDDFGGGGGGRGDDLFGTLGEGRRSGQDGVGEGGGGGAAGHGGHQSAGLGVAGAWVRWRFLNEVEVSGRSEVLCLGSKERAESKEQEGVGRRAPSVGNNATPIGPPQQP